VFFFYKSIYDKLLKKFSIFFLSFLKNKYIFLLDFFSVIKWTKNNYKTILLKALIIIFPSFFCRVRSSRTIIWYLFLLCFFTIDRDRPVLQRSEPSSCTTLILGEQPNPWSLFQFQDVISRHRGANSFYRYGRSKMVSLLSLAYLTYSE